MAGQTPRKRLSLHPLSFEEALANLIAVKPAAKGKKSRQKPRATRRKAKKGPKKRGKP
jgi:hypothetical protein